MRFESEFEKNWNARQRQIEKERDESRPTSTTIAEPSPASGVRVSDTQEEDVARAQAAAQSPRQVSTVAPAVPQDGYTGVRSDNEGQYIREGIRPDGEYGFVDFDTPEDAQAHETRMAQDTGFSQMRRQERYKNPTLFMKDWKDVVFKVGELNASGTDPIGLRAAKREMALLEMYGDTYGHFRALESMAAKMAAHPELLDDTAVQTIARSQGLRPANVKAGLDAEGSAWRDTENPETLQHWEGRGVTGRENLNALAVGTNGTPEQRRRAAGLKTLMEADPLLLTGETLTAAYNSVEDSTQRVMNSITTNNPEELVPTMKSNLEHAVHDINLQAVASGRMVDPKSLSGIINYFGDSQDMPQAVKALGMYSKLPQDLLPQYLNQVLQKPAGEITPGMSGQKFVQLVEEQAAVLQGIDTIATSSRVLSSDSKATGELRDAAGYLDGVRSGLYRRDDTRMAESQKVMGRYQEAFSTLIEAGQNYAATGQFAVALRGPAAIVDHVLGADITNRDEAISQIGKLQKTRPAARIEPYLGVGGDEESVEKVFDFISTSSEGGSNRTMMAGITTELKQITAQALANTDYQPRSAETVQQAVLGSIDRNIFILDEAAADEANGRVNKFNELWTGPLGEMPDIARVWSADRHATKGEAALRDNGEVTVGGATFKLTDIMTPAEIRSYHKDATLFKFGPAVSKMRDAFERGVKDGSIGLDAHGMPFKREGVLPYAEREQARKRGSTINPELRFGPQGNIVLNDVFFDLSNPISKAAYFETLRLAGSSAIKTPEEAREFVTTVRKSAEKGMEDTQARTAAITWAENNGFTGERMAHAVGANDVANLHAEAAVVAGILEIADPARYAAVREGVAARQGRVAHEREQARLQSEREIAAAIVKRKEDFTIQLEQLKSDNTATAAQNRAEVAFLQKQLDYINRYALGEQKFTNQVALQALSHEEKVELQKLQAQQQTLNTEQKARFTDLENRKKAAETQALEASRQGGRRELEADRQAGRSQLSLQEHEQRLVRNEREYDYRVALADKSEGAETRLAQLKAELNKERDHTLTLYKQDHLDLRQRYARENMAAGAEFSAQRATLEAQLTDNTWRMRQELSEQSMAYRAELDAAALANKWVFRRDELSLMSSLTGEREEAEFNRNLEKFLKDSRIRDDRTRMVAEYRLMETASKLAANEDSFFDSNKFDAILKALAEVRGRK